ncbi:hypothetical protein NL676_027278 [Syzygium grande]|nr:hypothetical protein NL676_027278 [Syzygium grande]
MSSGLSLNIRTQNSIWFSAPSPSKSPSLIMDRRSSSPQAVQPQESRVPLERVERDDPLVPVHQEAEPFAQLADQAVPAELLGHGRQEVVEARGRGRAARPHRRRSKNREGSGEGLRDCSRRWARSGELGTPEGGREGYMNWVVGVGDFEEREAMGRQKRRRTRKVQAERKKLTSNPSQSWRDCLQAKQLGRGFREGEDKPMMMIEGYNCIVYSTSEGASEALLMYLDA